MASVVCQGLQSCLEPKITESSFLTHKKSLKPTHHQKPKAEANLEDKNVKEANKNNGFSFFDILENPSSVCVKHEEVYVHPMVKSSVSALSTMSLDMCTESLGTETGSDVSESSDEFWEERGGRSKARSFYSKVVNHRGGNGGFPPPLTSMSGSDSTVKVRPHRKNGRLVIKAVSVSDCGTKFDAERKNGTLRLSLLEDDCVSVETGSRRKAGGNAGIPALKRRPKSFRESAEYSLSSCKDNKNKNSGFENWGFFRVVIS